MRKFAALAVAATASLVPLHAWAQDAAAIATGDALNSGDNAWVLVCSALVLLMIMPGLTLFYGGLVRTKNFLSVMIQVGAVAAVVSVLWIVAGYRCVRRPEQRLDRHRQHLDAQQHGRSAARRLCDQLTHLRAVPADLCRDHPGADDRGLG